MESKEIKSVSELISVLKADTASWRNDGLVRPWYRGVTNAQKHTLLPSVFRNGFENKEFQVTKKFRLIAPGFGVAIDPQRLDQWLFVMQHHGVPTRLLDWSESPLTAAFFALKAAASCSEVTDDAAIFALDPEFLNRRSGLVPQKDRDCFPVTWVQGRTLQTIKFAFGTQEEEVFIGCDRVHYFELPMAIYPSTVHPRLTSQKSCFTLHGSDKRDFETIFQGTDLVNERRLIKYVIRAERIRDMFEELHDVGVGCSSIFPDLDGLAEELKYSFNPKRSNLSYRSGQTEEKYVLANSECMTSSS